MGWLEEEVGIIEFKGTFDLKGMIMMMHSYLKHQNYDFYEKLHKAKVPELELEWFCERKTTRYHKYILELEFHFYDLKEVEVKDENGNTKKMMDGRFFIKIDGDVVQDFTGSWGDTKNNSFKKKMKDLYELVTRRDFMMKHAAVLIGEATALRDKTNSFLGMVASY